jgi:hypothetical protein
METKEKITTIWLSNKAYDLFEQFLESKIDRRELNRLMHQATKEANVLFKNNIIEAYITASPKLEDITKEAAEQYYTSTYTNEDDSPEPNEALKLAKERYDTMLDAKPPYLDELLYPKTPYVSDDFQIGPDGAFEDWDVTLMDGIEYESWDEIYEDYAGEADLHEFLQWLKNNFQVPNKLGSQNS